MTSSSISKFSNLHKSAKIVNSLHEKQSDRRQSLLNQQKHERNKWLDTSRDNILQQIPEFCDLEELEFNDGDAEQMVKNRPFENYLQLSEWLREKPIDLENWLLVPCPKGMRCIVVARNGFTELYHKSGKFLRRFHSGLPGDAYNRMSITILDCIYVKQHTTYYVLDVMYYADQDLINCECIFRFVWIKGKLHENDMTHLIAGKNDASFMPIEYYDCADDAKMYQCLSKYPLWTDNVPQLDGLLFYHKDSSYVHGQTPLVGWLYPFLLSDVLGLSDEFIHETYLNEKPIDYTNHLMYMNEFDRKLAIKIERNCTSKWQHKKKYTTNRCQEGDDDNDDEERKAMDVMAAEKELEISGRVDDDIFYGK